jgi:archaemetzincin
MNPESITLISFGFFEKRLLEMVMGEVEHEFDIPVRTREGFLDLSEFYDAARKQYNGNLLLAEIDARFGADTLKTLGVFNVDLFIPIFTYIFGQAYLNGRTGIASIYRLKNERYGLKSNQGLFLNRIRKEVIHELGHSLGLIHCSNTMCVMRSSTYVEDIDQKSHHLCPQCRAAYDLLRATK